MQGSIIDTACAIRMEDRYQAIELGVVPMGQLMQPGSKTRAKFSIHLDNCILRSDGPPPQEWEYFQMTFDGTTDDGHLFSTVGTAKGLGLEISDSEGQPVVPGTPVAFGPLLSGTQTLDYWVSLKSSKARLKPGEYWAIVRFKADYF